MIRRNCLAASGCSTIMRFVAADGADGEPALSSFLMTSFPYPATVRVLARRSSSCSR